MRSGKADDSWDIYQSKGRIGGRLDPHKFGIGAESGEDGVVILVLEVHIRTGDTLVLACNVPNVSVGSTIDIVNAEDVSTSPHGANHCGRGCRSRSECETVRPSLDGSESGLESIPVGVSRARVLESLNKTRRVSNVMTRRLRFEC